MDESRQHSQLPNDLVSKADLNPKDLLIYLSIRRYMNNETKEAFPSMETIAKHSSSTKPTVKKCIDNLVRLGYLSIRKEGRKNVYKFSPHKNFEPFSDEFLDKDDLSANEKAYIIATQQYMYKDIDGYGKMTYNDNQISKIINLSYNSVSKYNQSLAEKGYLSILKTQKKDLQTGLMIDEKLFHLDELGQAIVFTLQNHENRISNNESLLDKVLAENKEMKKQLSILLNDKREREEHNKKSEEEQSIIIL